MRLVRQRYIYSVALGQELVQPKCEERAAGVCCGRSRTGQQRGPYCVLALVNGAARQLGQLRGGIADNTGWLLANNAVSAGLVREAERLLNP